MIVDSIDICMAVLHVTTNVVLQQLYKCGTRVRKADISTWMNNNRQ